MANKRSREETSEQIHTRHKKVKLGDHGDAQRVDPQRFSFGNMNDNDPFKMQLPDDNDMDNKMSTNSRSPSNEPNMNDNDDTDFGLLLFQLASLDVDNNNNNDNNQNGNDNKPQTCPICSRRVSLKEFPDHVHGCLDAMDDGERNDMRTQCEKDSDFAAAYAIKHGYTTNYDFGPCPSCGKSLVFGMGMNEHVNKCLDEQIEREKEMKKNGGGGGGMDNDYYDDDDDEDDDISGIDNNNNNNNYNKRKIKKVEPMSREQMIECANKLMTLQQGSEQFDNMLNMFGALGFNKANVKSVLKIEKEQNNNNNNKNINVGPIFNNRNNNNNNNNNNDNNINDNLSPIAEEDVDLFRTNNDNRNKNNNQSNQNFEQFTFDDDDL